MCRGKHEMGIEDAAECARKCVKNGAKYVFISGDDMYRLEADPKQLDYYAEKTVTIRGEVDQGRIVKIEAISVVK
jgi:excinuclease UvrABC helicase subunit UvrB